MVEMAKEAAKGEAATKAVTQTLRMEAVTGTVGTKALMVEG